MQYCSEFCSHCLVASNSCRKLECASLCSLAVWYMVSMCVSLNQFLSATTWQLNLRLLEIKILKKIYIYTFLICEACLYWGCSCLALSNCCFLSSFKNLSCCTAASLFYLSKGGFIYPNQDFYFYFSMILSHQFFHNAWFLFNFLVQAPLHNPPEFLWQIHSLIS